MSNYCLNKKTKEDIKLKFFLDFNESEIIEKIDYTLLSLACNNKTSKMYFNTFASVAAELGKLEVYEHIINKYDVSENTLLYCNSVIKKQEQRDNFNAIVEKQLSEFSIETSNNEYESLEKLQSDMYKKKPVSEYGGILMTEDEKHRMKIEQMLDETFKNGYDIEIAITHLIAKKYNQTLLWACENGYVSNMHEVIEICRNDGILDKLQLSNARDIALRKGYKMIVDEIDGVIGFMSALDEMKE